jgi:hypothetical protein
MGQRGPEERAGRVDVGVVDVPTNGDNRTRLPACWPPQCDRTQHMSGRFAGDLTAMWQGGGRRTMLVISKFSCTIRS